MQGVMKKAYELGKLCGCEVALILMQDEKITQYTSVELDSFMSRYNDMRQAGVQIERRSSFDVMGAVSQRVGESPDTPSPELNNLLPFTHIGRRDDYRRIPAPRMPYYTQDAFQQHDVRNDEYYQYMIPMERYEAMPDYERNYYDFPSKRHRDSNHLRELHDQSVRYADTEFYPPLDEKNFLATDPDMLNSDSDQKRSRLE